MNTKCIMLVFGNEIDKDLSNVKSIYTMIVPNLGEEIIISQGLFKVKRKVIHYKNVEDYDLDSPERGEEVIYIFI